MSEINNKFLKELTSKVDLTNNSLLLDLEKKMLEEKQVDCPVVHSFGPGTYIREVRIPADTFAIGHHQNLDHMNIMLKGHVTILNDNGTTSELRAPLMFVGKPGRKVGYVHEDMVWLNVYATEEQDVEKLEKTYLTKSDGWVSTVEAQRQLKLLTTGVDNSDFDKFIEEYGLNKDIVRVQSENLDDMTVLPFGGYSIKVADSGIEGKGLFATNSFVSGDFIAPARIDGMRTIAGRYTNHSPIPNAKMVAVGDDIDLVALKDISGCKGGLDGEEITIDYRQALGLNLQIRGGKCQE